MIVYIVFIICLISSFLAFVAGVARRKALDGATRILMCYLGLAFSFNIIAAYLARQHTNNLWIWHVFPVIEYSLLAFMYALWQTERSFRIPLLISIPVFSIIGILNLFFGTGLHTFDDVTRPLAAFFLIIASAHILFVLHTGTTVSLLHEERFWISSAVLLYFGSTVIVAALSNSIVTLPRQLAVYPFIFSQSVDTVANIMYGIGFLCLPNPATK